MWFILFSFFYLYIIGKVLFLDQIFEIEILMDLHDFKDLWIQRIFIFIAVGLSLCVCVAVMYFGSYFYFHWPKAGNCSRCISSCFMQCLNKFNLKNTMWCQTVNKQCTGLPKSVKSVHFRTGFGQKFFGYFELTSFI